MKTILVVEDDLALAKSLQAALKKQYQVILTHCYRDAYMSFQQNTIQLIILDIQLPDGNGIDLCKDIRKMSQVPILFLTASDSEDKIVEGLNSGGDDYVTKPFRIKEFYARIQALLRRENQSSHIRLGDYDIHIERREMSKDGDMVILSPIDFDILKELLLSKNRILTREQLLSIIERNGQYDVEDNTLSVHIRRLRKKLGVYHGVAYIETVRGIGYRIHREVLYENK